MNNSHKLLKPALIFSIALLIFALSPAAFAAIGDVDSSFAPTVGFNSGYLDITRYALVKQADGKILIGENFSIFNGKIHRSLLRLTADGKLDTTFQSDITGRVKNILVQTDGKILISGEFTAVDGLPRTGFARLNADGSLDRDFFFDESLIGNYIRTIALQGDDKIIIGGSFSIVNNVSRKGLARLNANGSLDSAFQPDFQNGTLQSILVQLDGKIVVGGDFSAVNGVSRNDLARLNADGSVDLSFAPPNGSNNFVSLIALQSDSKILVGGGFNKFNNSEVKGLIRLNADGTTDYSFTPSNNSQPIDFYIQPNGKVLLLGANPSFLMRLNIDGTIDLDFTIPRTPSRTITKIIGVETDGAIITGGLGKTSNVNSPLEIIRFSTNGSPRARQSYLPGYLGDVDKVLVQPDGKILIGGSFTQIEGVQRIGIARLNADGTLDKSFNFPGILSGAIYDIALQSDGKILIAGSFKLDSTSNVYCILRLNSDGLSDVNFYAPVFSVYEQINTIALQSDGKIYIGGHFYVVGGRARNSFARLHPTGTVDSLFNQLPAANYSNINKIIIQSNGMILVGGNRCFYVYITTSTVIKSLVRISPDNFVDLSFNESAFISDADISTFALNSGDGKIIVGYQQAPFSSSPILSRLNADGSLDSSLNEFPSGEIKSILIEQSGKILIGGRYDVIDSVRNLHRELVLLNEDGVIDTSFTTDITDGSEILSLAKQADGKILIGGKFAKINNQSRSSLARIEGEPVADYGRADDSVFRKTNGL